MPRIFTHLNLDLDAVFSVLAVRMFLPYFDDATVHFVSANWNGDGLKHDDIAVDIEVGGRGYKGKKDAATGVVHSCFALLVERYASEDDQQALKALVAYIDAQDAHGNALKHFAPDLTNEAHAALSASGLNAVFRALQNHHRNDAIVLEVMGQIFYGLLGTFRSRRRAEEEALAAQLVGPEKKVAVVRNSQEYGTNGILFQRGVQVIVYVDGDNLGLLRNSGLRLRMDDQAFRKVVAEAGEFVGDGEGFWYAHPAGFLFCRGSRKSPALTPSKVDPMRLAETAVRLTE